MANESVSMFDFTGNRVVVSDVTVSQLRDACSTLAGARRTAQHIANVRCERISVLSPSGAEYFYPEAKFLPKS